ncbi:MAG: MBL fold metallo-hydrolase [Eubacteriales bacterium]
MLLLVIVLGYMIPYGGLYIAAIDVSQGSATYIRTPNNKTILIDGGSEYNLTLLEDYLQGRGEIDIGIITHDDSDHSYGIKELMEEGKIETVYTNECDAPKISIEENTNKILTLSKGDTLYFDGVKITVYNPGSNSDEDDSNYNSLVLLIEYNGNRILVPGDIPSAVEEDIMAEIGDIDVLFVAHHGAASSTSDEFLKYVKPETAIISVGKNNYGHPSERVLNSLLKACDEIYTTEQNGCVELYIDDKIRVETVR